MFVFWLPKAFLRHFLHSDSKHISTKKQTRKASAHGGLMDRSYSAEKLGLQSALDHSSYSNVRSWVSAAEGQQQQLQAP
jgi:hypothetical protein